MKDFFEDYLAIPLGALLVLFLTPSVMVGGFTIADHIFGVPPACEVRK